MKSNKNHTANKSLPIRYDRKSLPNENSKTKSVKPKIQSNRTTADDIDENSQNPMSLANQTKDMMKHSTLHDCKLEDDQDDSKKIPKEAVDNHSSEQSKIVNTIYQLSVKNYVAELHKALIAECKCNLLDFNLINATLDYETLSNVSHYTLKAIKDQKIFSVLGYFPKISEELKNRGWVEKRDPSRPPIKYSQYLKSAPSMVNWIESPPIISSKDEKDIVLERMKNVHSWMILKDKRSDFIFVTRKRLINWPNLHELTSVSQMTSHMFCTKNGLAHILESHKNIVTNLMFPRCHYIRGETDYDAFVEDYMITALTGVLEIIVESIENSKKIFSESGNIPYEMIIFSRRCVFKYLNKRQTGSTERDLWKFESEKETWNEFMNHYKKLIIDNNATFINKYTYELEIDVYAKCKYLLENVKVFCPQYYIDGNTNTWIVKPTANCSGHGIILTRELKKIKEIITGTEGWRHNYILQKYIEKPLLVYTCKIDLRQWFLVTNMNPVVVWMYKEGYVRFCANSFSMGNMHESIHLSNVRLQKKYQNIRRPNVPDECMWNYQDLKNHLTAIGKEHAWDELIFPGMCDSVYAVLQQATTDISRYRANTFQLFGADFVITDTFIPYLIEINSMPGLNPSTSVIANLVPMLLEDIVKVMIDRRHQHPNADTGLFVEVTPTPSKTTRDTIPGAAAAVVESGIGRFAPPVDNFSTAAELHRRWIDRVNEKLEAIRPHADNRSTVPDRFLGRNRDSLLMTLISMPPLSQLSAAESGKTDAVTLENASSNVAGPKITSLGRRPESRMEARRPRDDQRKR